MALLPSQCWDIINSKLSLVTFLTTSFLYLVVSSIGLEIRPQSAFTAFWALLPSANYANYSAEWSGRVWQPAAYSNGHLAHIFFNLKRAKQPLLSAAGCHTQPSQFKFLKKCDKLPSITSFSKLSHQTGGAALPSENISWCFSQGLWGYTVNSCLFFSGLERANVRLRENHTYFVKIPKVSVMWHSLFIMRVQASQKLLHNDRASSLQSHPSLNLE